jgi:hypothetical protein
VTADDFRRIALSMPGAVEQAHMGHPDFRVKKRIFATLGPAGTDRGMVKLTPAQQREFALADPAIFKAVNGAWGRQGATYVHLARADEFTVHDAIATAFRNIAITAPTARRKLK